MYFSDHFTEEEIEWIEKAIKENERYNISVDNDCISIDMCVNEATNEWDSVFIFDNYGADLLVQLFNYIGCHVEPV